MNPLLKGFRDATRPRERLLPWQWCEKHVVVDSSSSIGGGMKWRLDNSPWVRELMEVFADNRVETIVIRCSTQSSKTQTLILLLCWVISEDPAPALWVANAKDDLKQTVRDRISPTFDACKPVKERLIGEGAMEFSFTTMMLYFAGGGSKGKVKSKPIRWLFMDEVEEIPEENVYQALERTKAQMLKRRVLLSTPNLTTGLMEQFFQKGDQRTLHVRCPGCEQLSKLVFKQIKWDTNDMTKPDGKYNFDALAETIRWECPFCGQKVRDNPFERRSFAKNAQFVALNPNAPKHTVSFTWPSLIAPWVKWRDVVEKYLNARKAARAGDFAPLKSFYNDDCGQPWEEALGAIEDFGFLSARMQDYEFGEVWPEEIGRFMAADPQEAGGEHYWWVVRAFGSGGKSRLIGYGKALSLAELEQKRKDYNVPVRNAMIDTGWKTSEIYRFCLSTGWKAFKGEPNAEYFLHRVQTSPTTHKMIRRLWDRSHVDPLMGKRGQGRVKPMPLFRHCGDANKDLLADYMMGLVGEWSLPKQPGGAYLRQVTGERRVETIDPRGRPKYTWKRHGPNHLLDCELIIQVAAIITKLVGEQRAPSLKIQQQFINN